MMSSLQNSYNDGVAPSDGYSSPNAPATEPADTNQNDGQASDNQSKPKPMSRENKSLARFMTFLTEYAPGRVSITNEVSYSIRNILKDNALERNMSFAVPYDDNRNRKIFFSLPYIIADAIYKNTDIDTKDIQIRSDMLEAANWLPLLRGAVSHYLKKTYYGTIINSFRQELIDNGHLVVKEVDNESKIVNLLNIVRPPHIEDLQDGGLAEKNLLTWEDMLANKTEWEHCWDKIEQIKEIMDSMQKKTFVVYEWWTVDEFLRGEEWVTTKGCIKYLDFEHYEEKVPQEAEGWTPYIELERFSTPYFVVPSSKKRLAKLKKVGWIGEAETMEPVYPYEEQYLIRVPGRWLGMGIYELLRPETEAYIKTLNEKLLYDEMLHKGVLVHKRAPFSGNQRGTGRSLEADIINRIQTGTLISIKAGESIDRLNIGSLTADFLSSANAWFEIARRKAGVTETSVGETLPSSTPATIGVLNERQGKTAFDIVNEQQGLFLERLFTRFKLSSIMDELSEDEEVIIAGGVDELRKMEDAFIENIVNVGIQKAVNEGRIMPNSSSISEQDHALIKEAVHTVRSQYGDQRPMEFDRDFASKFHLYAKFYVTNESFDKQIILQALQEAINTVSQNPTLELDSSKLIETKLDIMGINPLQFRKSPEKIMQEQMQAVQMAQAQAQAEAAGTNAVNMNSQAKARRPQGEAKTFGEANQLRAS